MQIEKHPVAGNINLKNRNEKLTTAVMNWTRTRSIITNVYIIFKIKTTGSLGRELLV